MDELAAMLPEADEELVAEFLTAIDQDESGKVSREEFEDPGF
jgi:hypothetical protein